MKVNINYWSLSGLYYGLKEFLKQIKNPDWQEAVWKNTWMNLSFMSKLLIRRMSVYNKATRTWKDKYQNYFR